MPRWTWVVADPDGTHRSDWVAAHSRKITWQLDGPATAEWTSRGDDLGAASAYETATDLLAYRDDVLMFRGRICSSQDELDGTGHTISWSAIDYRGLLDRRTIVGTPTWANTEQTRIGWLLIAWVQLLAGGDMGITDASTPTGVKRDREYARGKSVGEALTQLGQVINGFNWDISPQLEYRTWYPHRGSARTWTAVYGDTISRVRRTLDTSDYATDILALGGENPVTGKTLEAIRSIVGPRGPGGWWDAVGNWSDVTVQATVDQHADAMIADRSVIRPSYELTVRPGMWTPDDAWLGDTTPLVIRSGRLDVTEQSGRIQQIAIGIGDDGDEAVTLTYGRRAATLADRFRRSTDQIATLSRR